MSFFSLILSIIPACPGEVHDFFHIIPLRYGIIAGTIVSLIYALYSSVPSIHGYRSDFDYFYHIPYLNLDISAYGVYSSLVSLIGMYGSYNKSENALNLFEIFTYLDLVRCMINSIIEGGDINLQGWGGNGKIFHPTTTFEEISSTVSSIWYYTVNIGFYLAAAGVVAISYSIYKAPVKVFTLYLVNLYRAHLISVPMIVEFKNE